MTKLQAAMKESSSRAQARALAKVGYKCGSYFKGCAYCGDTEEVETDSGKMRTVYTSGYNVYKAYNPTQVGWHHWCYDCGAKDSQCWPTKVEKEGVKNERVVTERVVSARNQKIESLQGELLRLKAMLEALKK